jgi:hypothetical protein
MKRQRASKWNKVRSECVCVKRIKVFFFMKKKDEEKRVKIPVVGFDPTASGL